MSRIKQQQQSKQIMKTSLAIPYALWQETKIRAVREGMDLADIVAKALAEYLAKPAKDGAR
jgi:hypothetical protein